MEKGTILLGILAAIAIVGVIIVAGMKASAPINIQQSDERNTLTVSGTKEFYVAPDQAELLLQVVTQAPSAKTASELNKDRTPAVMAALRSQGIDASQVETTGVTLSKVSEWDAKSKTTVEKGYQYVTTMRVTVADLDKTGDVLDAAVNAGANSVQDVRFTLRPETEAQYKQEALRDATAIAREKATLMADAAGAHIGAVRGISENTYFMPFASNVAEFSGGKNVDEDASLAPQRVSLKVSVAVTYELE